MIREHGARLDLGGDGARRPTTTPRRPPAARSRRGWCASRRWRPTPGARRSWAASVRGPMPARRDVDRRDGGEARLHRTRRSRRRLPHDPPRATEWNRPSALAVDRTGKIVVSYEERQARDADAAGTHALVAGPAGRARAGVHARRRHPRRRLRVVRAHDNEPVRQDPGPRQGHQRRLRRPDLAAPAMSAGPTAWTSASSDLFYRANDRKVVGLRDRDRAGAGRRHLRRGDLRPLGARRARPTSQTCPALRQLSRALLRRRPAPMVAARRRRIRARLAGGVAGRRGRGRRAEMWSHRPIRPRRCARAWRRSTPTACRSGRCRCFMRTARGAVRSISRSRISRSSRTRHGKTDFVCAGTYRLAVASVGDAIAGAEPTAASCSPKWIAAGR